MRAVIIDDEGLWVEKISNIIKSISDIDTTSFASYNEELHKLIYDNTRKIYFVDIELKTSSKSGYEIANDIRESNDWESIIIFFSIHNMRESIISNRLNVLTYISKFDNFEMNIKMSFQLAFNIINKKSIVKLQDSNAEYNIYLDDVLYIRKEKLSKYCLVILKDYEFKVRCSLLYLKEKTNFRQIKKHLLINEKNAIIINKNEITFRNNVKISFD